MRLIGHLESESSARTFSDFLFVQGIDNQLEFSRGEGWGVWVNEEEKLQSASNLLQDFRKNPSAPTYQNQAKKAEEMRSERTQGEEAWRKRLRNRRHLFRPLTGYNFGPLTFGLIVVCVIVFLRSSFGMNTTPIQSLFITPYLAGDEYLPPNMSLPEIRHGEIWRLFTPMFIHFGPLHIIFNMLWLRDLGSMIEGRQSTIHLAILILIFAAGSNLAEFYISRVAFFGGMSGVIYGLLGYVWIRGKLDPGSGLYLHKSTVIMMLIWLVVCFTGAIGHIANYAHLAGLLMGVGWGWLSSLRYH